MPRGRIFPAPCRYLKDGGLDRTFGAGGVSILEALEGCEPAVMSLQADGQVVMAGTASSGTYTDFFVARFLTDGRIVLTGFALTGQTADVVRLRCVTHGTLDAGFGNQGLVLTDLAGGDAGRDLAVQPAGRIVLGGSATSSNAAGGSDLALARDVP